MTRADVIERALRAFRAIGSPAFPQTSRSWPPAPVARTTVPTNPTGVARQAIASVASGDRTERLHQLDVPTLVIHGLSDRLCDVSGGRATADAVPGAELVVIEGMGHNLPPGLHHQLARHIGKFVWRAERG